MSNNEFSVLVEKSRADTIKEYKMLEQGLRRTRIFPVVSLIALLIITIFFPNIEKSIIILILMSPIIIDMVYVSTVINKKLDLIFKVLEADDKGVE